MCISHHYIHPKIPLLGFAIILVPCEHAFLSLPYTVTRNISQESAGDLTRVESHNSAALFYALLFWNTLPPFSGVHFLNGDSGSHFCFEVLHSLCGRQSETYIQENKHLNEISKQNHFSLFQRSTL